MLPAMEEPAFVSVGLGGDGDEIAAITEVERTFGVLLDKSEAAEWITAGDVFSALCRALPEAAATDRDLWTRFARSIVRETGVDPTKIRPESPLIPTSRVPYWVRSLIIVGLCALGFLVSR